MIHQDTAELCDLDNVRAIDNTDPAPCMSCRRAAVTDLIARSGMGVTASAAHAAMLTNDRLTSSHPVCPDCADRWLRYGHDTRYNVSAGYGGKHWFAYGVEHRLGALRSALAHPAGAELPF